MIVLWIAAALISALASGLILHRSARAAALPPGEDPALAVYRRQLSEIDDLADRGLLPADQLRSAHAEAARRLLSAADEAQTVQIETAPVANAPARRWVAGAAIAVPLLAACLYLAVGSPGVPDQPFARRLQAWADTPDKATLTPPQLTALLSAAVVKYPTNPVPLYYLSRVQAQTGDFAAAVHSLKKALGLAPNQAPLWSALGAMLTAQSGAEPPPDALAAFAKAHALDPSDPDARYFLARARIGGGDVDGGLAEWRALAADMKPDDSRKGIVLQQIAMVEKAHGLPPDVDANAPPPQVAGGDQQAFIRSMVAALAARLQSQPDDPAGWARLIRSYAVLGDRPSQAAALARARELFKTRPADLRAIETAASAPQ